MVKSNIVPVLAMYYVRRHEALGDLLHNPAEAATLTSFCHVSEIHAK